jgi:hypothetical protein
VHFLCLPSNVQVESKIECFDGLMYPRVRMPPNTFFPASTGTCKLSHQFHCAFAGHALQLAGLFRTLFRCRATGCGGRTSHEINCASESTAKGFSVPGKKGSLKKRKPIQHKKKNESRHAMRFDHIINVEFFVTSRCRGYSADGGTGLRWIFKSLAYIGTTPSSILAT